MGIGPMPADAVNGNIDAVNIGHGIAFGINNLAGGP